MCNEEFGKFVDNRLFFRNKTVTFSGVPEPQTIAFTPNRICYFFCNLQDKILKLKVLKEFKNIVFIKKATFVTNFTLLLLHYLTIAKKVLFKLPI